ncbi:unnamed protein product [Parnassius apollo]|uniref:(apollo) hypothetical protein n=1 Tax=Parnassius apollo TaxID=110799 RepID=A0A8S3XKB7_PARAO|nr:unnamed protein product [Parnassius apollo]
MFFVIIVLVCAWNVVCGQDTNAMTNLPKYDSRYDYLDVDALFNSKRLVSNYVNCLINLNRCTPEGKVLKRLLPEALRTKCLRCTERQKRTAVKIIKRLKYEYPDEWAKVQSRWDPTGDFTRYFETFLANEQFNTIIGSDVENAPPPPAPLPEPNLLSVLPAESATPKPATVLTTSPTPPSTASTPIEPLLLNRFGDDDESMVSNPSPAVTTSRPTMSPITSWPTTIRPRPTPMDWAAVTVPSVIPTRFTLRPVSDTTFVYSTAITLIDEIGNKIIRTTELVADLLKSTVRAVVG